MDFSINKFIEKSILPIKKGITGSSSFPFHFKGNGEDPSPV
jgi:hypothetical protein